MSRKTVMPARSSATPLFGGSANFGTKPSLDPLSHSHLTVQFGDVQGRMAVVVTGRKVGSAFHEKRKGLRPRVPLGGEMGCRSAPWATCVYIGTVGDQPRNSVVNA